MSGGRTWQAITRPHRTGAVLLAAAVPSRPATARRPQDPGYHSHLRATHAIYLGCYWPLRPKPRDGLYTRFGIEITIVYGDYNTLFSQNISYLANIVCSIVLYNHLHATNFHAVMCRVNCRGKSTYVGHGMQAGRDYFQGCKLWGGSGDVHSCNCCAPAHRTRPSCIFDDIPTLFAVQRDLVVPHYPTRAATLLVFFTMVAQQANQQ